MSIFQIPDGVVPEPFSVDYADDVSVLLTIYYIGAQALAYVTIDSAGDMTFEHGDSSTVDDDTKLDAGGLGVIDLSADVTDYASLVRRINSSDNWRAVLKGALPDDDPHTTTTGHFTEVTDGVVKSATVNGYDVMTDDSDSLYIVAGMTFQGIPTKLHGTDHNVIHVLQRVIALSTYASGTSLLKAYACDDDSGVSTLIKTWATGATTVEVLYPAATVSVDGHWEAFTKGKRLAVKLLNSAALGTVRLAIEGFSYARGPGKAPFKWWGNQAIQDE